MRFAEVVATSDALRATSARSAKRDALAALLARLEPAEVEPVVGFLTGELRQGSLGVGWATLAGLTDGDEPPPGSGFGSPLEVLEVDAALDVVATTAGAGSRGRRHDVLNGLFTRAGDDEARFLTDLLTGQLRQGALAGVMVDAVARAAGVGLAEVRRAVMLDGRIDRTARLALTGGSEALAAVRLQPGRALQPMLASAASSPGEVVDDLGTVSVEWKLDGIRIQVHRVGDEVRVYSRNLNDLTTRVPTVVDLVRGLPGGDLVLDGEAMALDDLGRPALFQESVSSAREGHLRPYFFDVVHLGGHDLLDEPLLRRRAVLVDLLAREPGAVVPATTTDRTATADAVLADALAAGHEGIVAKGIDTPYEAGRRGRAWRKVKPVHTLDLVVLAVEWGSGRRTGWLSNLHLGAREPAGGFVMVGKTFKGLTDDLLRWQTERFLALAVDHGHAAPTDQRGVVHVRPEQVVEIAVDGVQRSTRYPGGVALRFARVVRYRTDKSGAEADTLTSVRALLGGGGSG